MEIIEADEFIDITTLVCPMTFVRTKLMLEKMASGKVLDVRLKGTEPFENVPRSAREHGHVVLSITPEPDAAGVHRVLIQKQ